MKKLNKKRPLLARRDPRQGRRCVDCEAGRHCDWTTGERHKRSAT